MASKEEPGTGGALPGEEEEGQEAQEAAITDALNELDQEPDPEDNDGELPDLFPAPDDWMVKMHPMHWCNDPGGSRLCIRAWTCPCILAGQNAEFAGNSYAWACISQAVCPFLHPLITGSNRYQLKQVLGIKDKRPNRFWDLCVHCWLPCCSVLQEHKEIIVRTDPSCPWSIQKGQLYNRPQQRTFDDSLGLVWTAPPKRLKKKKPRPPKDAKPNLVIRRRKSLWEPVEKEQNFETFYA